MALSRVHTWASLETLTASDLNAEFNNILNYLNGSSIALTLSSLSVNGHPVTVNGNATLNQDVSTAGAPSFLGPMVMGGTGNGIITGNSTGQVLVLGTVPGNSEAILNGATNSATFNSGSIKFSGITTTASAANAFLDNANSNNLLRSTSSIAVKDDIRGITLKEARCIVHALFPFSYRSKAKADDPKRRFFGLGAEHVAEVSGSLVHYTKDGKPDGVMYDRVGVLNLVMTQNHDRRLRIMEAAVCLLALALVVSWTVH